MTAATLERGGAEWLVSLLSDVLLLSPRSSLPVHVLSMLHLG